MARSASRLALLEQCAPRLGSARQEVEAQDLAEAGCALSVDGGRTFGPAVPIYTATDCAGIHGHVKVAPDGTVYVPARSCGASQQGVAVSEDNGVTWTVRLVTNSTAGDTDPSVGIATDGTVYFGYEAADGHARIPDRARWLR